MRGGLSPRHPGDYAGADSRLADGGNFMKLALMAGACLLVATPALAATPTDLCKTGQLVIVRTSKITPTGSKVGFQKAVRDNQAWYRAHGITQNQQVGGAVLDYDPATKNWSVSPNMVASIHVSPPEAATPAPDAAW